MNASLRPLRNAHRSRIWKLSESPSGNRARIFWRRCFAVIHIFAQPLKDALLGFVVAQMYTAVKRNVAPDVAHQRAGSLRIAIAVAAAFADRIIVQHLIERVAPRPLPSAVLKARRSTSPDWFLNSVCKPPAPEGRHSAAVYADLVRVEQFLRACQIVECISLSYEGAVWQGRTGHHSAAGS